MSRKTFLLFLFATSTALGQTTGALLTKQPALWEDLFTNSFGGDVWGVKSEQRMLSVSLSTLSSGIPEAPFYRDVIDGGKTAATKRATEEAIDAWRKA